MSDWREPITDRMAADVAGADDGSLVYQKGALNADDLNRIEGNYRYILEHLETDAIFIPHAYRNREETTFEPVQVEEGGLDDTTLLLLHGESLEDSSNYKRALANINISPVTVDKSINEKVLSFGSGKKVYTENGSFMDLGTGDFTIEWREYVLSTTPNPGQVLAMSDINTTRYFNLEYYPNGKVILYVSGETVTTSFDLGSFEVGKWVHRALVRCNGKMAFYKDGTKQTEASYTDSFPYYSGSKITFGSSYGSGQASRWFDGYMEEIRISNVARWAEDFTPPEKPYGEITIHTETKPIKKTYTDWQEHNLPWLSEINRIRANYNALVRLFLVGLGLPVLAESNYLDWQEVNDWERIAMVGKQMFENMEQEYRYCGVEESGGDRLL
ncbi:MAG: LamG domain-containing protein [Bacteroidales bacterium]|nr:LamG domain-containing protein [Anaerotignum sp.]MCI5679664.1 LamG domain-containing protein [Bacteroidales bacterium]MDY3925751.1 LamG domain-containing protein [Anaerotignum sp.]